jgi:hypothetical protein
MNGDHNDNNSVRLEAFMETECSEVSSVISYVRKELTFIATEWGNKTHVTGGCWPDFKAGVNSLEAYNIL